IFHPAGVTKQLAVFLLSLCSSSNRLGGTMDFGLKRRTAIVAAASSGLGKAIAMELATEGANLVINSRSEERLSDAANEIRHTTGAAVLAVVGDVTDETFVAQLISDAKKEFGRIDILIANAGGPPAGFFSDFDAKHYRDALELNLISTV